MEKISDKFYTGERSLFMSDGLEIENCEFGEGESPLKESKNVSVKSSVFGWKYPLWYGENVAVRDCVFKEMSRAGVWYTSDSTFSDCKIDAPKLFRRCASLVIENTNFSDAKETLWACSGVKLKNVSADGGDYFAMNSRDLDVENLTLHGNYSFDGAKNVVIRSSVLCSKDAFWNSENVTVYDSVIEGEYLGWNAKNLTLINCTVRSHQGMCYVENLVMKDCKIENTDLAFEYSSVDVTASGKVDSIKNPSSGRICVEEVGEIILEKDKVNTAATEIFVGGKRVN